VNKNICSAILATLLLVSVLVLGACCSPARYTLSTSSNPAEGGSISPSGGSYVDKTEVTLTAAPAAGYRFDHWGGQCLGCINHGGNHHEHSKNNHRLFRQAV